ncbi:MAG: hypothetical protein OXU50_02665 [Gammaproteobacteria bacterium]|nr:hypothetical protein [Gammaproteobacteria bacterium]MDD9806885.1 hypothetical protein [Gammaproteobacteria bacterium]MDD9868786.1 hypothetical protein [Gammaproteobacteria bacterium]
MTWFIFIGDLVVMAGMIVVAVWVFLRANAADLDDAARIPLDDDGDVDNDGGGGDNGDAHG